MAVRWRRKRWWRRRWWWRRKGRGKRKTKWTAFATERRRQEGGNECEP